MPLDPMPQDPKEFFRTVPNAASLQQIHDARLDQQGVQLYLKREDLLHPTISGNKWRKLKYNLIKAHELGHTKLLTFGGAYSNHILATAAAGARFGIRTIGIIRGEEYSPLNPVLAQAKTYGMALHYVSRAAYRHKMEPAFLEKLRGAHGEFYLLPEGGTNGLAIHGCSEIVRELQLTGLEYDVIATPCGTGGTLAGLIYGLHTYHLGSMKQALGISVLKSKVTGSSPPRHAPKNVSMASQLEDRAGNMEVSIDFLSQTVLDLLPPNLPVHWQINHDYALGGYAKITSELTAFIHHFEQTHHIALDPVYTGKMLFALYNLVKNGQILHGTKIIALLTGVNQSTIDRP